MSFLSVVSVVVVVLAGAGGVERAHVVDGGGWCEWWGPVLSGKESKSKAIQLGKAGVEMPWPWKNPGC